MSNDIDLDEAPAAQPDSGWRLLHAQCPVCDHRGIISNRIDPERKITCSHCGSRASMSAVAAGLVGLIRQPKMHASKRPRAGDVPLNSLDNSDDRRYRDAAAPLKSQDKSDDGSDFQEWPPSP